MYTKIFAQDFSARNNLPATAFSAERSATVYTKYQHKLALGIIATDYALTLDKAAKFKEALASLPKNYAKQAPLMVSVADTQLLRKFRAESYAEEICWNTNNNYDVLMRRLQATVDFTDATLLLVSCDFVAWPDNYLAATIKQLLGYSMPVISINKIKNMATAKHFSNPLDLITYADAHFNTFENDHDWLPASRPYMVLNKDFMLGVNQPRKLTVQGQVHPEKNIAAEKVLLDRAGENLPQNKNILFFEPHQDDYIISAATFMKRLLQNNNRLRVVSFFEKPANKHKYLAGTDKSRLEENKAAFSFLAERACAQAFVAYQYFEISAEASAEKRKSLISQLGALLRQNTPDFIVIPALQDTQREHVRLRKLVLAGLNEYSLDQEQTIPVYSVPLFSAEKSTLAKSNLLIIQNESEVAEKRRLLALYPSQKEYTDQHSPLVIFRENIRKQIAQDIFKIDAPGVEFLSLESLPRTRNIGDSPLYVVAQQNRLAIAYRGAKHISYFCYNLKAKKFQLLSFARESWLPTKLTSADLNQIAMDFLDIIYQLDRQKLIYLDRKKDIHKAMTEYYAHFVSRQITDFSAEPSLFIFKIMYEKYIAYLEDRKIETGLLFATKTIPSRALLRQRLKNQPKILIGLPTYKGESLLPDRIRNIQTELNNLSAPLKNNISVELVLFVNGKTAEVKESLPLVFRQALNSLGNGINVLQKITILKDNCPSQANAIHKIFGYARENKADIVTLTDDDIKYSPGTLNELFTAILMNPHQDALLGIKHYWIKRDSAALLQEIKQELAKHKLSEQSRDFWAKLLFPYRNFWEDVSRFHRASTNDFAVIDVCGAGLTMWTEGYKGIPFWIRQSDIVLNYRHKPHIEPIANSFFTGYAANSISQSVKFMSRAHYGYRDDINVIFSKERVQLQNNPYLEYFKIKNLERNIGQLQGLHNKVLYATSLLFNSLMSFCFDIFDFLFERYKHTWIRNGVLEEEQAVSSETYILDGVDLQEIDKYERICLSVKNNKIVEELKK
ncbi:hypothetical protein NO2_0621 [Candidatus Termititenax persephonae]|uniref:Uncharacterized protein n=1 Tax=Candidatus Termititenax persephonae TaxID=2218525 RepID=A0A388TH49_9BACT|nr:hypothetical protein NO2_0621 [Candidatus Termititenax persephonae]